MLLTYALASRRGLGGGNQYGNVAMLIPLSHPFAPGILPFGLGFARSNPLQADLFRMEEERAL